MDETQAGNVTLLRCRSCGADLRDMNSDVLRGVPVQPCDCGASDIEMAMTFHDALPPPIDDLGLKARDPEKTGRAKRVLDMKVGTEIHRDSGRLQHRDRRIDFIADQYDEVITDLESGKVVKEVHERLSEHRRRGSARRK